MLDKGQLSEDTRGEREIAWRVLKREIGNDQTPERLASATSAAFGRVYNHLVVLIGPLGFESLLRRSIYLAKRDCPFLGSVITAVDGETFQLRGLDTSIAGREFAEARDGLTLLLGTFFWLLVRLVGQNLFWQLIRGVWPDLKPEEAAFSNEEKQ